jgi:hypothetical protein
MKFLLIAAVVAMLAASFARHFGRSRDASYSPSGIGTDPGDIRSGGDILAAAHRRGHDLAIFGAG